MKSILSASVCAAALAFAVPALAATDSPKHAHHHMGKHGGTSHGMSHGKMSGKGGDSSTEQLNEKSLAAARGGSTTGTDASAPGAMSAPASGAMAPATGGMAPSGSMAPSTGVMTPPASGTTGTTTPMNAPGGGQ